MPLAVTGLGNPKALAADPSHRAILTNIATPAQDQSGIAQRTLSRVTRRLMPFLFLLYIIAYIDRINIGFAGLQMTSELHFSNSVFGFGSGIFFAGYALLGIPGAVLIERWSARKAIAATMLVWGCVASATGLIHSAPEFYGMRVLLGITEAGFFPGVIAYLSHWYRKEDRAKAVAMFMAASPVSQVIASPVSAALLRVTWGGLMGWRWLLILEGVPAIVAGVMCYFYLADRPRDAKWLRDDEREWLARELEREHASKGSRGRMRLIDALNLDVGLLALAYFGSTCGTYGLSLWMPKMIQKLGSLNAVKSALLAGIPAIAAIPAMLLNGWHSDRTGERRWHTAIPRISAAVALAAIAMFPVSVPATLALLALALAGIFAGFPPLWAIPSSFLGATAAAASIGLINAIGNLGGFFGPYFIGKFSQGSGDFTGGMWFISIAALSSGFFVLLVRKRHA
jgi:ACS family tartrate transporter-like MFS transporter